MMSKSKRTIPTLLALVALSTLGAPRFLAAVEPIDAHHQERQNTVQHSPVYWLHDFSEVAGAHAKLTRKSGGITYILRSGGLEPGHVVTVWFCGWNDPTLCVDGPGTCGAAPEDLAFELDGAFCLLGGGGKVKTDGTITLRGRFEINEPVGEVLFGAFTRPLGAEINLVVKTHGPLIPQREWAQRSSYDGGCSSNACEEIQLAIFPPQ